MKLALRVLTALVGLALLGALALATLRVGSAPAVSLQVENRAIGPRTGVVVSAAAPGRGLSRLRLEALQSGRVHVVFEKTYAPLAPWAFRGTRTERDEVRADVGGETVPDLRSGEVVLRAIADRVGTWLLRPTPSVRELRLAVRLEPPTLGLVSTAHYLAQGGAHAVVYRVGPTAVRDGVSVGEWFFPGVPLPGGGPGDRFALLAVPWSFTEASQIHLQAVDDAGNTARLAFVDRFASRPPARDRITLDDAFLGKVVPEILSQTPALRDLSGLLDNFLQINRDLRRGNASELAELAGRSAPRFLWSEPFLPLRGAEVTSAFADRRTYVYGGKEVDEQVHLGFDLASVQHAPVPAANRGLVLVARYFGIYGNTVILDHGYGLQSLYAHLSSIDVKEGHEVERGQVLGRTGSTGLAGGDHLHFTMLVGGVPVNPKEWWDPHWVRDRVARPLGAAFSFREAVAAR